ncbi:MAG: isoprenylcysteine carboxylmethyltransferase family protein [Methanobrevibacter sp.]|uniref:methyltransferase family protein n=1 Tax=Methanobrevibacter sp. TaxID=66852 RepID=UPI0025EFADB8|nr:isoprenylcysteine carboxylmethyltransferase family protein [Methanobrevibacter sp.]MBQ8018396.1 isoprenylcysteine carboxylmethyltransferase family protein [Methanobrevibacter sp.]
MVKNNNHLPLYGVGPILIAPLIATAILGLILTNYKIIPKIEINILNSLITIFGILLIVIGIAVWIFSAKSDIDENIKSNKLKTDGIYGIIRHPIYAAFLYASTGLVLMSTNIYLFILPVLYWIFLSVSLKNTEEKWLTDMYGNDYILYSKKVNRFIPKVI